MEAKEKEVSRPIIKPLFSFINYRGSHCVQKDDSEEPDTIVYSEKALSEEFAADNVADEVFPQEEGSRASIKSGRVFINSDRT